MKLSSRSRLRRRDSTRPLNFSSLLVSSLRFELFLELPLNRIGLEQLRQITSGSELLN